MALIARHAMGAKPTGVNSILLFFLVLIKKKIVYRKLETFRPLFFSTVKILF
jgi:hypothetical protein